MGQLLRRVTESQGETEWKDLNEGFWCFEIGKPELAYDSKGKLRVKIPLLLTPEEQKRQTAEFGDPPEGIQQSWRATYRPTLNLGFRRKATGVYEPSMLIDFLAAALGTENGKKFRKWVEDGGGPRQPDNPNDADAEKENITNWLGWWEGLLVYGTITHSDPDKDTGRVWVNFAGPMPLGSLPGQPEHEYQALCRGKYRAMRSENESADEPAPAPRPVARTATASTAGRPAVQFTADGDEIPF